jgi:hypothetical protein
MARPQLFKARLNNDDDIIDFVDFQSPSSRVSSFTLLPLVESIMELAESAEISASHIYLKVRPT